MSYLHIVTCVVVVVINCNRRNGGGEMRRGRIHILKYMIEFKRARHQLSHWGRGRPGWNLTPNVVYL